MDAEKDVSVINEVKLMMKRKLAKDSNVEKARNHDSVMHRRLLQVCVLSAVFSRGRFHC